MSEHIERRRLFLALAENSPILAARVMPFPHKHRIDARGRWYSVDATQVQALVDAKLIAGTPNDALWDSITFKVTDARGIEGQVRSYYPRGYGYCVSCGDLFEPLQKDESPVASRHGFVRGPDRKEISPPCEGSGKPLVDTRYLVPKVEDAAA